VTAKTRLLTGIMMCRVRYTVLYS